VASLLAQAYFVTSLVLLLITFSSLPLTSLALTLRLLQHLFQLKRGAHTCLLHIEVSCQRSERSYNRRARGGRKERTDEKGVGKRGGVGLGRSPAGL
jgi:hypothetical protein